MKGQDPQKDPRTLLVARDQELGHRICQGMCGMSAVKDPYA